MRDIISPALKIINILEVSRPWFGQEFLPLAVGVITAGIQPVVGVITAPQILNIPL